MQKLNQGIHQFQGESFQRLQRLFEQLGKGQKPETQFIPAPTSESTPAR